MKMRCTAVCAATVMALFAGSAAQADVLLASADIDGVMEDVRQKIEATGILAGHTIDTFDLAEATPTAKQLAGYDAVLSWTDFDPQDASLWGDLLADYVDSGGGLLQMAFSWVVGPDGRVFDDGYSPLLPGGVASGVQMGIGTTHCPKHPVMSNVNSFEGYWHNTGGFAPGSIAIANWDDDLPFAAEMPGFNARIVALNFWPPSTDERSDGWDATTDGDILMANALAYVMTPPGPIPSTVGNYKLKKGKRTGGDVDSLGTSDNDSLEISALQTGNRHRTMTVVTLRVACPDITQLDLRVETGVNAGNIKTRVQVYDFDARRWRLIEKYNQPRRDRSRLWENLANPGRFVSSNGLVKVRIATVRKGNNYILRHDQVEVLIKPITQ